MDQNHSKYYFQLFEWPKRSFAKKRNYSDWEVFLNRINVIKSHDMKIPIPRLRLEVYPEFVRKHLVLLEDFNDHVLGNIFFYEKKIVNERTARLAYILISLSLLLLVPILVAFLQEQTTSIPAQITAMFTGIFALYQGVSKWLESRNVIGTYWQTKSNLMSRLLSIESKWSYAYGPDETWSNEDLEELREDLRKAVRFGLDCQKTEKQIFFDNYNYPQFNILGTILGTRNQVQELFKRNEGVQQSSDTTTQITNPRAKLAQLTEKADEPIQERTANGDNKRTDSGSNISSTSPSSAPKLITRKEWGAKPSKRKGDRPTPLGKTIKSIVIHHAAGYWDGRSDGKVQMRGIQKLHQDDRKWIDIGYQFVVDPLGNIYQGREFMDDSKPFHEIPKLSMGAHVASSNTGRIGICLLGNYHTTSPGYTFKPTQASHDAIISLATFLVNNYHPQGDPKVDGNIIVGHKDVVDKPTNCPGDDMYRWLGQLRMEVQARIVS